MVKMNLLDLGELIEEGADISKDEANRSYLRSSFKRTVSGWESGFEKVAKVTDETKQLKLQEKLKEKMKKEADKYLKETKNLVGEDKNKILIKNPQLYKKINKAKQDLKNNIKWFNDIVEKAGALYHTKKEITSDKGLYEPFCKYYYENVADENIIESIDFDEWIEDINFDEHKSYTPLTGDFSKWLDDELLYLEKFKDKTITIQDLIDYYNHGAYINKALIDKIPAKKINSATTGYFDKLSHALLRKILLAVGIPSSAFFFFTPRSILGICEFLAYLCLMPITIVSDLIINDLSSALRDLKEFKRLPKYFFKLVFLFPILDTKPNVKKIVENIQSIGKEDFTNSFINDLSKHKIKINDSASKTLASLTNKTTKKINKLEDELKKLEITKEPKKVHGTNKVKYMEKVLETLK